MNRINKTKLLSILAIFFILIGFMPTICKAENKTEENTSITMKVSYGIQGNFKGSTAVPVNIEVENNGENIEGQLEVRVSANTPNTYDAFVSEINIGAKEKRTVTIPINLPENALKLAVVLKQGENIIKQNTVLISNGRVGGADMFMGILADDFNGLAIRFLDFSSLNNSNNKRGDRVNKTTSVPLQLNSLLRSPKNISSLDVIVINNYNTSNLQREQYENLSTWVENGGILIIGSGENSPKTIENLDKEFFNITYNGTKDINGYTLAKLNLKDATVKLQEGEDQLIYLINKGQGKIYIATFDLGNKTIATKDKTMNIWKECLGKDFLEKNNSSYRHGGNGVPYGIEELSNNVPYRETFNMWVLIIIFISYALIVGLIIYLIMKKLNKREWLWGIIPAIAIAFSLSLYILGSSTRIKDIVLNQVNIVTSDKNGTSKVIGYAGIGSKYKNDLKVQEPIGTTLQNFTNDNYHENADTNNFTKLGTKTVYRQNNSYFEFKNLSALSMKQFEISGHKEIVPSIDANLNYSSRKLSGKIKNTLGYDIQKLLVVSYNTIWELGAMKSDEEKEIESMSYSASGLASYGDSLRNNYYRQFRSGSGHKEKKEEFKDVLRMSNLISSIGETNINNQSTYLIAVTDMPIDYRFDFGGKSVSKYDTTAIIQEINVDFTDNEGNLDYPLGYFKGSIVEINENVDIDTQNNVIFGSGDLVLDYTIDKDINLLDLKVGYVENPELKKSSFKGSVSVYNYKENQYKPINYIVNGESLKNPTEYIKDGKVRVKMQCNNEEETGVPQITVKGRTK
ncbi:hypothetical protein CLPUN_13200 [Clostridium puniceum]|uniref:Uncharacterized protein n=1 Tax=Clostridium puniceum TaxID=29367 RepID=A0A1S8TSI1_9CLOT|nr:CARDB domain-containing protein [Clostridium puniceum]OOM80654.1 hypothetical protein CLPUN_13200 [Clostridium puniceum]